MENIFLIVVLQCTVHGEFAIKPTRVCTFFVKGFRNNNIFWSAYGCANSWLAHNRQCFSANNWSTKLNLG